MYVYVCGHVRIVSTDNKDNQTVSMGGQSNYQFFLSEHFHLGTFIIYESPH